MPRHRVMMVRSVAALACLLVALFAVPAAHAEGFTGKRVLHIDSYHRGNTWNDRIADAVQATLVEAGVDLKIIHMDTKRNRSEAFKREAALRVKAIIDEFQPDVVTASDDNASRYVIMQHYREADLPFVFCGVNWDASEYGFPYANVTGMVEVSPIPQIVQLLRRYAKGDRIGVLTEDTPTKRKEIVHHERFFSVGYEKTYFVKTFAEWTDAYRRAQDEVDMLVILGHAALTDFDDDAAKSLAESATNIPTGTDFGWLMHLSMLGVGKVPEEQGQWAAKAALKILAGTSPSKIPLAYNKEGKLYFNPRIASRLGVDEFPPLAEVVN